MQLAALQLHGTGTALGDPIELNAALAALVWRGGALPQPLALAAHKAASGHAEPAAGMIGLSAALSSVEGAIAAPLLHLRHVSVGLWLLIMLGAVCTLCVSAGSWCLLESVRAHARTHAVAIRAERHARKHGPACAGIAHRHRKRVPDWRLHVRA